jgi:hypothetical protein
MLASYKTHIQNGIEGNIYGTEQMRQKLFVPGVAMLVAMGNSSDGRTQVMGTIQCIVCASQGVKDLAPRSSWQTIAVPFPL